MENHGVPGALLPLVILTELGGGLLIVCGYQSRLAALALTGFCILTALLFHTNFADANELIQFNKDIAIAGGFLVLVAFGAGDWSLDALQARRAATLSSPSDAVELQG
jgi:putative oxidoreductase